MIILNDCVPNFYNYTDGRELISDRHQLFSIARTRVIPYSSSKPQFLRGFVSD